MDKKHGFGVDIGGKRDELVENMEKEWILISAYDASGSGKHSVIYALDAVTTEFVALFKILNADGSVNKSHGGGIAASEYNFYYADTGSNISYFPLLCGIHYCCDCRGEEVCSDRLCGCRG